MPTNVAGAVADLIDTLVDEANPGTAAALDMLGRVTAGFKIAWAAEAQARQAVAYARAQGHTWHRIAEVLHQAGVLEEHVDDRAMAAFLWAAPNPSMQFHELRFSWQCPYCDRWVHDYGPQAGDRIGGEVGHAEDCGRLISDTAQQRRRPGS